MPKADQGVAVFKLYIGSYPGTSNYVPLTLPMKLRDTDLKIFCGHGQLTSHRKAVSHTSIVSTCLWLVVQSVGLKFVNEKLQIWFEKHAPNDEKKSHCLPKIRFNLINYVVVWVEYDGVDVFVQDIKDKENEVLQQKHQVQNVFSGNISPQNNYSVMILDQIHAEVKTIGASGTHKGNINGLPIAQWQ